MRFWRIGLAAVLAALTLVGVAAAGGKSAPGTVTLTDHTWRCQSKVDLASVSVTITPSSAAKGAVLLEKGCSGAIGSITVVTSRGDGIGVGGARYLIVKSIQIVCKGRATGAHQDGVQATGGNHVTFEGGYVGCYSANNSQVFINGGANTGNPPPTDVIFEHVTFDPRGAGAHGLFVAHSLYSGFEYDTLLSNPKAHPCVVTSAAAHPVWVSMKVPAADTCPHS